MRGDPRVQGEGASREVGGLGRVVASGKRGRGGGEGRMTSF